MTNRIPLDFFHLVISVPRALKIFLFIRGVFISLNKRVKICKYLLIQFVLSLACFSDF